jgi:hypothetical protein
MEDFGSTTNDKSYSLPFPLAILASHSRWKLGSHSHHTCRRIARLNNPFRAGRALHCLRSDLPVMAMRRPHSKSRRGCVNCKRRKVKVRMLRMHSFWMSLS